MICFATINYSYFIYSIIGYSLLSDTFIGLEKSEYTVPEDSGLLQICVYGTLTGGSAVLDVAGDTADINGKELPLPSSLSSSRGKNSSLNAVQVTRKRQTMRCD